MPQKIKQEDGTEIEVYTSAEVQQQQAAAIAPLQEELKKLQEKDFNFGKLREGREADQKRIEELTTQIAQFGQTITTKVTEEVQKGRKKELDDARTAFLDTAAANDPEYRKKLELEYAKLSGYPETTPDEIATRIAHAATIVSGVQMRFSNGAFSSSGAGAPPKSPAGPSGPVPQAVSDVAKKMGFTDEQIKKFGGAK